MAQFGRELAIDCVYKLAPCINFICTFIIHVVTLLVYATDALPGTRGGEYD